MTLTPSSVKLGRVAERVVTADGDQMLDAERGKIRQHLPGEVPGLGVAVLGAQGVRKVLAGEMIGQLLHFRWIGAARMQHGAAVPIDGAGVLAVQGDDVTALACRVIKVQVREALPAAPETNDFDIILAAAVGHGLDDRIQAGDVAATGENANALLCHDRTPALRNLVSHREEFLRSPFNRSAYSMRFRGRIRRRGLQSRSSRQT